MKKTAALTGVSVIGAGLAVISVSPAQAAPVSTPACTDSTQHTVTVGNLDDDWFMDCVPQYGTGKVSFEIDSADPVPAGFVALDDPSVSSTFTGDGPAAAAYFGVSGQPNGFKSLDIDSLVSPTDNFHYRGNAIFKVASVEAIDPSSLPPGCDTTTPYAHAYRVDYEPSTVTFSQVIDGNEWKVSVTLNLPSVYLGYNFAPADPGNPDPNTSSGSFDPTMSQCLISDWGIYTGANDQDAPWVLATNFATSPEYSMWPNLSSPASLGTFSLTATPHLADTGADPAPFAIAGGLLLLGGGSILAYKRRRVRRGQHV